MRILPKTFKEALEVMEKFFEVKKLQQEELKQIKSPLDGIMGK